MKPPDESVAYRQPELSVDERVDDLLSRMSLAEKVGQVTGTYVGQLDEKEAQSLDDVAEQIRDHGLGVVSPFGTGVAYYDSVPGVVEAANELQTVAVEETRLGIPLLFTVDAIHGHAYVKESTVFPNNLGAAATWDTALVERTAGVTAREVCASGGHQNYSPSCDVGLDPRWGRIGETFGESPFLASRMVAAKVDGYGDKVISTAKHFPAYGAPERGEDAAPVDVSEYRLRRTFLPPFEAALAAGVDAVMPCYNAVDGEPVHGSARFLDDLLRSELGFDGLIPSDWEGVEQIHEDHRTAPTHGEAVRQAHAAGLDVASIGGVAHAERLLEVVESGDLPEERLDASVRRLLSAKFRLGLFEDPYADPGGAEATLGKPDHQTLARECARRSLTLLKNEDVLPLGQDLDELLVAGPNADDLVNQLGGWSVMEDDANLTGRTIREGLEAAVGTDTTVSYEQGTTINDHLDVDSARERAAEADAAVVVLGENWYIHEFGPQEQAGTATGEFPTRSELRLPEAQRDLVRAVHETGTPTVAVLVTGRPLIVDWLAEHVPAVLLAYYPGSSGGDAVADVLLGDADPGGRLPVSIPRSPADLPVHHDTLRHPHPIGDGEHPDSYAPLYPFGHGLSYADFEYRDLSLSDERVGPEDTVTARVTLANVGERPGKEVVQVYARDRYSSRVVPDHELRGFERVELDAGEQRTVEVTIDIADLSVVQPDGHRRTEGGDFDVLVEGFVRHLTVVDDGQ